MTIPEVGKGSAPGIRNSPGAVETKGKVMRVAILDIHNFRGIREGRVHFKDHPVLIGANNTGKTTVVAADRKLTQ